MILDSQHWYRIFNESPIGIAIVGLDGTWIQVNKELCRILEYSEAELLGKTFQEITHPEDLKPDLDMLRKLSEGKIDGYDMLKRYITKTGKIVWTRLDVAAIKNENEVIHCLSHIQEITRFPKIEQNGHKLEVRPTVSFTDFFLDNWKCFISAAIFICSIITSGSVMLYKAEVNQSILEKQVQELQKTVERIQ